MANFWRNEIQFHRIVATIALIAAAAMLFQTANGDPDNLWFLRCRRVIQQGNFRTSNAAPSGGEVFSAGYYSVLSRLVMLNVVRVLSFLALLLILVLVSNFTRGIWLISSLAMVFLLAYPKVSVSAIGRIMVAASA